MNKIAVNKRSKLIKITFSGILTFLLTGSLFCQVQTKDIYDVLNRIIEINHVEVLNKKAVAFDIGKPSQNEFIVWCTKAGDKRIDLSQVDSVFIMEQIERYHEMKWDKKNIDKKIRFRKRSSDYFTIPLFLNKNKDLVIVYHRQYSGPLASEGKYELYEKVNDQWKLINIQIVFVS